MDLQPAAITPELASAALASPALSRALKLADWIGAGRDITNSGVLRPAVAMEACAALGIDLPPGTNRLRSAQDVPELMRDWEAAWWAGLITVSAKRVYGPGFDDVAGDAAATLNTWLRALAAQFGLPGDPCAECLTILATITEAGPAAVSVVDLRESLVSLHSEGEAFCPDCGRVHALADDDYEDDEDEDDELHAIACVGNLLAFGAVTGADSVTLTPLGRMLADSVFAALAPAPQDSAGALVMRLGSLPASTAILYSRDWLAVRTPVGAASELFDFAQSATPRQRAIAFALAEQIGPDAAPAWRERAEAPGYGAYVRAWLEEQGERVPSFPHDAAWMAAEAFSSLLDEVPPEFAAMALGLAMQQAGPGGFAEAAASLRESGHPDAPRLLEVIGATNAPRRTSRLALARGEGRSLQLMITLREVYDPPVWRRVVVPESATLGDLHAVIQAAMGWEDAHMHAFRAGRRELAEGTPLREVLPRRGSTIQYDYDFGDDWEHDIKSEGFYHNEQGVTLPACLDGGGACPPEDCGGAGRYDYLKTEILTDPDHEEHDDVLDWLDLDSGEDFDPAAFSLDEANERFTWLRSRAAGPRPDELPPGVLCLEVVRPTVEFVRDQPRAKKPKAKRKR